jgi:hypothetical protein
MKRFTSILLLFCLSLQMLSSVSVVTFYQFRSDLITELFCENKDRPVLQCEGKCFVSKQLKHGEEERQRSSEQTEQTVIFHLTMPSLPLHLNFPSSLPTLSPTAFYQAPTSASHLTTPFHPPRG